MIEPISPDAHLGVLVSRRSSRLRPYHEQTTFFRRLIAEAQHIGVAVFVFSPGNVNWSRRRIRGWTWQNNRWVQRMYPFPDAVFDRVSPKQRADMRYVPAVRRRFQRVGVPLFNTKVGDKWDVHKLLNATGPPVANMLPPTGVLTRQRFASMMRAYGELYVKPAKGGQGRGIVWVAAAGRGRFVYRIHHGSKAKSGSVRGVDNLYRRIRRPRLMVVQKAISILRYNGRPFDVRALVQKDVTGEWQLTGIVARVGAPRKKVTNIHAGGKAMPLDEVLMHTGSSREKAEEITERAGRLAVTIASIIGARSRLLGELGIDLAIDDKRRLWFLEANSRTGRISLHRAGLVNAPKGDRAPAEYALYLSKLRDRPQSRGRSMA